MCTLPVLFHFKIIVFIIILVICYVFLSDSWDKQLYLHNYVLERHKQHQEHKKDDSHL